MTLCLRVLARVTALLACAPGCGWAQADALKNDPFTRPPIVKIAPSRPPGSDGANREVLARPPWKPDLAAVMVAGPKSVVSIDGTLVRIGDEINGHRLVEVREQTAVFVKNGKKVTLTLRGIEPALPGAGVRGTAQPEERKPQ